MSGAAAETRSQNVRSRSTRRAGGLPAMSAALIAPIDNAGDPIGRETRFGETFVRAGLVGAERAAALQHEHRVVVLGAAPGRFGRFR